MQKTNSILALFILIFFGCWSCSNDDDSSGPNANPNPVVDLAVSRGELSSNVGNHIILPAYETLSKKVEALNTAIDQFTTDPDLTNLESAQSALKEVWLAWQPAAVFQFGPAESVALRNFLNTYPTDTDKIQSNIANGQYNLDALTNQAAAGLPAIDYLLNGTADTQEERLKLYTESDLKEGYRQYLSDLVRSIENKTASTLNDWSAAGNNYIGAFTAEAARGTDAGSALGLLVNAIDLHYQRFVRDGKLAIPAGIRSAGVPRPKATEAFYAGYSVELLQASLQAYHRLFLGVGLDEVDRKGLYDYLVDLEAKDLADDMRDQFEIAIQEVEGLMDPLSRQIENDLDKVNAVFVEMQKLVPLLKSDMASTMGIIITNQDNDGD